MSLHSASPLDCTVYKLLYVHIRLEVVNRGFHGLTNHPQKPHSPHCGSLVFLLLVSPVWTIGLEDFILSVLLEGGKRVAMIVLIFPFFLLGAVPTYSVST